MGNEIELISDGDGLAVIGEPGAVERFLESVGLPAKDLDLPRLGAVISGGSAAAQAGAMLAAGSGRWVQLTSESAEKIKAFGLMDSATPGVSHAMIGQPGGIESWVQIAKAPTALAANPAMLAGAAGIMAQLAMQQTMSEITDYLARIDAKLDGVLRSQTNQVLAGLDGIDLAVKEATTVRNTVGRVSDVTWSKVQNSASTIFETQGYALRQLQDLTEKLEQHKRVDELVKTAREAEADVKKWLTVLARCFQLHDAVAVLELDRVLDSAPDELDRHRLGLQAARQERLELISQSTAQLIERMDAAAAKANSKVLLNPIQSPAVVEASNSVAADVHELRVLLAIESERQSADKRAWKSAASERWDKTRESGESGLDSAKRISGDGLGAVKNIGGSAFGQAKSVKGKLGGKLAGRKFGRGKNDESDDEG